MAKCGQAVGLRCTIRHWSTPSTYAAWDTTDSLQPASWTLRGLVAHAFAQATTRNTQQSML